VPLALLLWRGPEDLVVEAPSPPFDPLLSPGHEPPVEASPDSQAAASGARKRRQCAGEQTNKQCAGKQPASSPGTRPGSWPSDGPTDGRTGSADAAGPGADGASDGPASGRTDAGGTALAPPCAPASGQTDSPPDVSLDPHLESAFQAAFTDRRRHGGLLAVAEYFAFLLIWAAGVFCLSEVRTCPALSCGRLVAPKSNPKP
jgi:hypothetical protein